MEGRRGGSVCTNDTGVNDVRQMPTPGGGTYCRLGLREAPCRGRGSLRCVHVCVHWITSSMLFVPVNYTHAHAVTRTSELCAWTGKPPS